MRSTSTRSAPGKGRQTRPLKHADHKSHKGLEAMRNETFESSEKNRSENTAIFIKPLHV